MTLRNYYTTFKESRCELFTRHSPNFRITKIDGDSWIVLGCKYCYSSTAARLRNGTNRNTKIVKSA
jgi:hypothetical protein